MTAYILRRLLLIVPTLVAIMVINFIIVQAAPGSEPHEGQAGVIGSSGWVCVGVWGVTHAAPTGYAEPALRRGARPP